MKRAASTVTIAILLALGLPAITAQANPGLTVTPLNGDTLTAADLVDALVGTGISTSNEAYAYVSQATGTFSGGTGIIGFESGVLLTTGSVANVVGPNESDTITAFNEAPGDPDLDVLAGRDDGGCVDPVVHVRPGRYDGHIPICLRLRRVQRVRARGVQ